MSKGNLFIDGKNFGISRIFSATNFSPFAPLRVEKVIYNIKGKATIVYWSDDTKTIVKCAEGELFDKETGLAMAYIKKMMSRRSFLKIVESGHVQE